MHLNLNSFLFHKKRNNKRSLNTYVKDINAKKCSSQIPNFPTFCFLCTALLLESWYKYIYVFIHDTDKNECIHLLLGLCPRLFITIISSGKAITPSSSLSKSIKTSLYSATCSNVRFHSSFKKQQKKIAVRKSVDDKMSISHNNSEHFHV